MNYKCKHCNSGLLIFFKRIEKNSMASESYICNSCEKITRFTVETKQKIEVQSSDVGAVIIPVEHKE